MDMPKYMTDQELNFLMQNIPKSSVEQKLIFLLSTHREKLEKKFPELYNENQVNVCNVNKIDEEIYKQLTLEINNIQNSEKEIMSE